MSFILLQIYMLRLQLENCLARPREPKVDAGSFNKTIRLVPVILLSRAGPLSLCITVVHEDVSVSKSGPPLTAGDVPGAYSEVLGNTWCKIHLSSFLSQ